MLAKRGFDTLATLADTGLPAPQRIDWPAAQAPRRIRPLLRPLLLGPVEWGRHAQRRTACWYVPAGWVAWWGGLLAAVGPAGRAGGERLRPPDWTIPERGESS